MTDNQSATSTEIVEGATLTQLNEAVSYIILGRELLAAPKPSDSLLAIKSTDPERYSVLLEELNYEHYDRIRWILKLQSDHDIRLFPIGNKYDQINNPYARIFNGRIQNIPVNFSTHLLMLRIDMNLLPADFSIPAPDTTPYS